MIKSPATKRTDRSAGSLTAVFFALLLLLLYQIALAIVDARQGATAGAPSLFQRDGDGDPAHHIVELKVPFRAEQMTVVAVDTSR